MKPKSETRAVPNRAPKLKLRDRIQSRDQQQAGKSRNRGATQAERRSEWKSERRPVRSGPVRSWNWNCSKSGTAGRAEASFGSRPRVRSGSGPDPKPRLRLSEWSQGSARSGAELGKRWRWMSASRTHHVKPSRRAPRDPQPARTTRPPASAHHVKPSQAHHVKPSQVSPRETDSGAPRETQRTHLRAAAGLPALLPRPEPKTFSPKPSERFASPAQRSRGHTHQLKR